MRQGQKILFDEDEVVATIELMRGNVSLAARKLKVSRWSLYKFMKTSKRCQRTLEDARESLLDNMETALYQKALSGDITAMIFFLKCQGKSRGWVERQEVTGAGGAPLMPKIIEVVKSERPKE